jgi:hypothetical protein
MISDIGDLVSGKQYKFCSCPENEISKLHGGELPESFRGTGEKFESSKERTMNE